ncbi:MAG: DUF2461 domain-containing protein, partial [Thermomicrobiales bacterium]
MSHIPAAAYRFEGFGPQAIEWFVGLEEDNSKSYFEAHRQTYEDQIREPMLALLMEASTHYGGDVKMFRPHRDIRFSRDKSPYKTATYGVVRPETSAAGLFAAISSAGFFAGTGYYQMATDQLDRFRVGVSDDSSGPLMATIVEKAESNGLTVSGESLKSAPRGYPKDHPRIRLLRMKEIVVGATMPPGESLFNRRVFDFAMATWKTAE